MNNQRNYSSSNLFIVFISAFLWFGCSDNSPLDKVPHEIFSGTYELEGIQINERYCLVGCLHEYYGQIMSSDTVETKFTIKIQVVTQRKDSLLFMGLEGADENVKHVCYTGSTNSKNCAQYTNPRDCAYAKIEGDQVLFDLYSPFGSYKGKGVFDVKGLILETNFFYRGLSIDYKLLGRKVGS